MALKFLNSRTHFCVSHLVGAGKFRFPTLDLRSIIRRPFLTDQISDHLEKAKSENVDIPTVDAAKPSTGPSTSADKEAREEIFREFLLGKGADTEAISSVLSRYPRALHRTSDLQARWEIWKDVLETDQKILEIISRSPESFFKSNNLQNVKDNISYFDSLYPEILKPLMVKSPRTMSNRVQLNRDVVEYLKSVCVFLGGDDPEEFARKLISKNVYLLTRSTRVLEKNIRTIQTSLKVSNADLLSWIQGYGFSILNNGNAYIRINFNNIKERLQSLGCSEKEISECILSLPWLLKLSPASFNAKMDLLLGCGVEVQQILKTPWVFNMSSQNIERRIEQLKKHDYNFQASGIAVLTYSSKRFKLRLEKTGD